MENTNTPPAKRFHLTACQLETLNRVVRLSRNHIETYLFEGAQEGDLEFSQEKCAMLNQILAQIHQVTTKSEPELTVTRDQKFLLGHIFWTCNIFHDVDVEKAQEVAALLGLNTDVLEKELEPGDDSLR